MAKARVPAYVNPGGDIIIEQVAYGAFGVRVGTDATLEQDTTSLADNAKLTLSLWVRVPEVTDTLDIITADLRAGETIAFGEQGDVIALTMDSDGNDQAAVVPFQATDDNEWPGNNLGTTKFGIATIGKDDNIYGFFNWADDLFTTIGPDAPDPPIPDHFDHSGGPRGHQYRVVKYNPNGTGPVWSALQLSELVDVSPYLDTSINQSYDASLTPLGIACDSDGNVVVAFYTREVVAPAEGSPTHIHKGYLRKYDDAGGLLWSVGFGENSTASSVCVDDDGNIYNGVTSIDADGAFTGAINFQARNSSGGIQYSIAGGGDPPTNCLVTTSTMPIVGDEVKLIDRSDGHVHWTASPSGPLYADQVGGKVFVNCDSAVVALDASTGEQVWSSATPDTKTWPYFCATTDVVMQAYSSDPGEPGATYHVRGIKPADGTALWTTSPGTLLSPTGVARK